MKKYDLVIVGAGAAGIYAASQLADTKLDVLLLEKKSKIGIKLLISGAGQCNFSQDEDRAEFIKHFYDKKRFVKSAIFNLDTNALRRVLEDLGLKSLVRDDGKIFPASLKSADLVNTLYDSFRNKIDLRRNCELKNIEFSDEQFTLETKSEKISTKKLILATGGYTYPSTGSSGDGYRFAKALGHSIVEPRRALSAFTLKRYAFGNCAGISLKDVKLSVIDRDDREQVLCGDILFTHKGISGPAVLHISRYVKAGSKLRLSLVGFDNKELFRQEYRERIQLKRSSELKTFLNTYLVKRLSENLIDHLGFSPKTKLSQLNKNDLSKIFEALTGLELEVAKLASIEQSMLSAGGVSSSEIYAKTMESKIIAGLYFAGELIDVDGESGGYNIHWAFASAALAVKDILKKQG